MEEGDDVGIHAAGRDPQLWVVKRRSDPDPQDCYMLVDCSLYRFTLIFCYSIMYRIYCPKESDLFWNLPNGAEGTTVCDVFGSHFHGLRIFHCHSRFNLHAVVRTERTGGSLTNSET
jgi:hypothetical protein